jgi:hypothetical protein
MCGCIFGWPEAPTSVPEHVVFQCSNGVVLGLFSATLLERRYGQTADAFIWLMPRHVHSHKVRVVLVVALILIFAGVVIDSLFSASWALDDGLLLAAAAVIALAVLLTRGRGRSGRDDRGLRECAEMSPGVARPGRWVVASGPTSTTAMQRSRARRSRRTAGSTRPARMCLRGGLAGWRRVVRRRPVVAREGEVVLFWTRRLTPWAARPGAAALQRSV